MIQEFLTWGKERFRERDLRFEENFRRLHSRQQRWDERGIPMPRPVISTELKKSPCTMVTVISGKYVFRHTASLSTEVCLNVSNYLKSQISKTSPPLVLRLTFPPASGGTIRTSGRTRHFE